MRWLFGALLAVCALCGAARADDKAVTPGAFVIERPTLLSLGFEWKISGDDNRNAVVAVTYRSHGESSWRQALPLFRMGGEFIAGPKPQYGGLNYYNYTVPPGFAGSVLNLEPDTEYDVHFVMSDPDGGRGEAEKTSRFAPASCRPRRRAATSIRSILSATKRRLVPMNSSGF